MLSVFLQKKKRSMLGFQSTTVPLTEGGLSVVVSGCTLHYSQLSPCGHPAITDTSIIRTADKFRAKINYRHLTEINSRYYGLSLQRTLT